MSYDRCIAVILFTISFVLMFGIKFGIGIAIFLGTLMYVAKEATNSGD